MPWHEKHNDILDLYRKGNREQAFNEIVKTYGERLYWHVRSIVLSHEDTNDLLQEIFIKIWDSLPAFRGDSGLYTWLYRIATNESLNFLSRQKIRTLLSFEKMSSMMEKKIDEDPYFNGDEIERNLSKAIARLPAKQRAVFCMRYYDEMPYEQIAEITGSSTGSLKASYHFAYEKVKKFICEKSTE